MCRCLRLIGIVLIAVSVGQTQDDPCTASSTRCNFYADCLNKLVSCGPDDYPLGDGFKYCSTFLKNRRYFSDEGQKWVSAAGFCLQKFLQDEIVAGTINATTSCQYVKDVALSSHKDCYTKINPSICEIPITDWIRILYLVRSSFNDPKTFDIMWQIGQVCGATYLTYVTSILGCVGLLSLNRLI